MHDRACQSALAVAPCAFSSSSAKPLRGSCGSKCSRCSALQIFNVAGEPLRGSCVSKRSCGGACEFQGWPANPLTVFGLWERWRVERPENFAWNRRPSRCFGQVAALARGVT